MPNPTHEKPDYSPGRQVGITIDQEQRACYAIRKHLGTFPEQEEMYEALDVWPDTHYQTYLNGN